MLSKAHEQGGNGISSMLLVVWFPLFCANVSENALNQNPAALKHQA